MNKPVKKTDLYYLRINPGLSGIHSVHKKGCPFEPDKDNRIPFGRFSDIGEALLEAGKYFQITESCCFCNNECFESESLSEYYSNLIANCI